MVLIVPLLILLIPVWIFVKMCFGVNNFLVSTDTTWSEIVRFKPEIGWKPISSLDNVTYLDAGGDKSSITTGKDGWPGRYQLEESDVVVFGDSFAFGYGSVYRQTYYGLSEEIRIKPVAAPGYNMVQGLLLLKRYREKLNGKLIIWLICLENDLVENIQPYNSMFYNIPYIKQNHSPENWEIVTSHITREKWLFGDETNNTLKFATICTPSMYSDRVMSGCKFLIKEAKIICDVTEAKLMIFTIPDKRQLTVKGNQFLRSRLKKDAGYDEKLPDKLLMKICKDLDIGYQAGMEIINSEDYKINDSHWNKSGNRKLSEFIRGYYKRTSNIRTT